MKMQRESPRRKVWRSVVGLGAVLCIGCGMPTIGRSTTSVNDSSASNPVAVFRFEDNLNDSSGNNNNATSKGSNTSLISYVVSRSGSGKAIQISNGNIKDTAYINLPENLVDRTFTISYWAKVTSWNTGWGAMAHMIFKTNGGSQEGFISHGANSDTSFYARNRSDLANDWGDIFATLPTAGAWFHVTETMDATGLATLYINGTSVGT